MDNFILFANGFVGYLICFVVFTLAIVIACFIGIALRKSKNNKIAALSESEGDSQEES